MPFSSASSRHTPSPQIQQSSQNISLLRDTESPPICNPSPNTLLLRNTESPSIRNPTPSPNTSLLRNTESPPIRNSTSSPSSRNLTISPQSIQNPQFLSDLEPTSQVISSQENVSTLKRSENMQLERNNRFGGWIKKRKRTDTVEANFQKVSSELSLYLRNSQNTSNACDVESFGKWISCELGKLSEINKKQKMEKITQIIFS